MKKNQKETKEKRRSGERRSKSVIEKINRYIRLQDMIF